MNNNDRKDTRTTKQISNFVRFYFIHVLILKKSLKSYFYINNTHSIHQNKIARYKHAILTLDGGHTASKLIKRKLPSISDPV